VVTLIANHMLLLTPDKKLLRRRISRLGADTVRQLLALQRGDYTSKGVIGEPVDFDGIESALEEILSENPCLSIRDLAINGGDLMALGFRPGPRMGQCLSHLLEQVLQERLPNEKSALRKEAAAFLDCPLV
jgi:tRNA nucleotidyltransferase (CCA-adding enzyme)